MEKSTIIIVVIVAVIILLICYVIGLYNKIINAKNKMLNQFSQIDIQLKRRSDLIPNLVETVSGYAGHEEKTLKEIVELRNKANSLNNINDKIENSKKMEAGLGKIFALAESYPELKANENFKELQKELSNCEDKISYARQFYNDAAMNYNNIIEMFPSSIVASMFNFKKFDYFNIDEKEKENPKVKF